MILQSEGTGEDGLILKWSVIEGSDFRSNGVSLWEPSCEYAVEGLRIASGGAGSSRTVRVRRWHTDFFVLCVC